MNTKSLVSLGALTAVLVGCGGGGDINIAPATTVGADNSVVNNSLPNGSADAANGCAVYELNGETFEGVLDGVDCVYPTSFVDLDKPLSVDLTIPAIPGVHVFQGSLVVGKNYSNDADMAAAGITQGGDGAKLTIAAGQTLAFQSSDDYLVINRGSQIFAEGTSTNPITVTSVSDAVDGSVGPEDVSEWGGMIINGFGVTNKCAYTGTRGVDLALASECHVAAEGKAGAGQTNYGGNNDADSSGVLNYFIVKHTGALVDVGNELNGIAFDAVGSGTQVDYIQAYSTYDDGVEMFGGAVNISHYVATYVRDDSIDIDEGYIGTFDYALVIQSETDGNRCIESDGIGSYSKKDQATIDDFIARGLHSAAKIKNLTCIVSAEENGTHDPGQGLRIREAHMPTIQNAIVTSAYSGDELKGDDDHYFCVRIDNEGQQAALDGELKIEESIMACQDLVDSDLEGSSTVAWLNAQGNQTVQTAEDGDDPTINSNANLVILSGFYSLPIADMVVNGGAATVTPTEGRDYIGAVSEDDNWISSWTYGLEATNRGQPLWFE
mgnify:CR=1 FL=1